MKKITLNSDVGEGAGFDAEIMPHIAWANIACGGHTGSRQTVQKTIRLAMKYGVKIGAHPSYPDPENFGRVSMKLSTQDLIASLTEQIGLVKICAEKEGGCLHHIKPHGALYNDAVQNEEIAWAILESIKNIDKSLKIITLNNSKIAYLSGEDFEVKSEAFADRNYNDDGTLVSRKKDNAILMDPEKVFEHVFKMISEKKIWSANRVEVPVFFDTICVHGDHPNCVRILRYLKEKFLELSGETE